MEGLTEEQKPMPQPEDFMVYEPVTADPEYKIHKGFVYNDHMYQAAIREWETKQPRQ